MGQASDGNGAAHYFAGADERVYDCRCAGFLVGQYFVPLGSAALLFGAHSYMVPQWLDFTFGGSGEPWLMHLPDYLI